jgi:hypothetical protein
LRRRPRRRVIWVDCITLGAITTGVCGKGASIDPTKADKLAGLVKAAFDVFEPIPREGLPSDLAPAAVFLPATPRVRERQNIVIDDGQPP